MDMSFFVSCPLRKARAGPVNRGTDRHVLYYSSLPTGRQVRVAPVPRFTGHAEAPVEGHDEKKDMSMLNRSFLGEGITSWPCYFLEACSIGRTLRHLL
jgi:hypothetical protein